ncbi:hypothetical protein GOP47_0022964 [Adiantum capillus-veneris]|uniref:Protein kinase domain-containing protein n=1 Tax=Adiantum capillus-veneris TaxID=13818 RepID=A0A9D4Z614_ADICA|nr:hypothetical protein GOP47_0022964 [Adiantum capillus-veneris]
MEQSAAVPSINLPINPISKLAMIASIRPFDHAADASGLDAFISSISAAPSPGPSAIRPSARSTQGIAVTALIMTLILISLVIVGALLSWRLWRRRKSRRRIISRSVIRSWLAPMGPSKRGSQRRLAHPDDEMELSSHHLGLRKFSYKELKLATQNFHNSQLLGSGGYGCVFKGTLQIDELDGSSTFGCICSCKSDERVENNASSRHQIVAVKRISIEMKEAFRGFKAELTIISDLRHRNLVRLQGWGEGKGWLFLVYDYMPNGSLDSLLYDDRKCEALNWARRFNICLGLGSALLYLHEEVDQVVLHRDIKSSNVLLDENFNAKLGDFGLSRLLQPLMSGHDSILVAGTQGYMALEIFRTGRTTKQSDVFAFGAVLAELATGRKPLDKRVQQHYEEAVRHVDWMWDLHSQGKLMEAADERLEGNFDPIQMGMVMIIALACSHPEPKLRPCIRNALDAMLGTSPLPSIPPCKPPLSTEFSPTFNISQGFTSTTSFAGKDDTHRQDLSNDNKPGQAPRTSGAMVAAQSADHAPNTSLPALVSASSASSYQTARFSSIAFVRNQVSGPSNLYVRLRGLLLRSFS